jgi:hypothetical protein
VGTFFLRGPFKGGCSHQKEKACRYPSGKLGADAKKGFHFCNSIPSAGVQALMKFDLPLFLQEMYGVNDASLFRQRRYEVQLCACKEMEALLIRQRERLEARQKMISSLKGRYKNLAA